MVEYREHLKNTVAVANNTTVTTISTGLTALVQNYAGRSAYMNALCIHGFNLQFPAAYIQTDSLSFSLGTRVESGVKMISDAGIILADSWVAGTAVGACMKGLQSYQLYPPELVSSEKLYLVITTGDTGNVGTDIIYTIRKVSRDQFINAMLPSQV